MIIMPDGERWYTLSEAGARLHLELKWKKCRQGAGQHLSDTQKYERQVRRLVLHRKLKVMPCAGVLGITESECSKYEAEVNSSSMAAHTRRLAAQLHSPQSCKA